MKKKIKGVERYTDSKVILKTFFFVLFIIRERYTDTRTHGQQSDLIRFLLLYFFKMREVD